MEQDFLNDVGLNNCNVKKKQGWGTGRTVTTEGINNRMKMITGNGGEEIKLHIFKYILKSLPFLCQQIIH
jgi:hypothetical protein